jgi:hypothetical protein
MKERTIVSAFAMIGSLSAYYYAKYNSKDPAPLIMIGGFVGALVGEIVSQIVVKNVNDENNQSTFTQNQKQLK